MFDDLGAKRLAERRRRLGDLLQQVVRGVTAVDVARRHFREVHVGLVEGDRAPVVGDPADTGPRARVPTIEHDHLALARGIAGVHHRLAVEPHVRVALGDEAVGLARYHEHVGGQTDVQRLPTAALRKQQGVGIGGRLESDRHRPLERRHRRSERLHEFDAGSGPPGDERRDHLGVGGDLGREVQPVERLQIGVVVDVTVERGDRVRLRAVEPAVAVDLFLVQRVGIRLGDDPDAGPTRVREHQRLGRVGAQREVEEVVLADLGPEPGGVVAELADLGRGLVHEREPAAGRANGTGGEQRVGTPAGDDARHRRISEVEAVAGDHDVQAGRIAARAPRAGRSPTG